MRLALGAAAVVLLVVATAWWSSRSGDETQVAKPSDEGGVASEEPPRAGTPTDEAGAPSRRAAAPQERPAPGLGAPRGLVEGLVRRTGGGEPLVGARVRIRRAAPPPEDDQYVLDDRAEHARFDGETTTDAEGRFSFAVAEGEPWRVVVTSDRTALAVAHGIGPSRTELFAMASGGRPFTVRFLDATTREPVAGTRVRVWARTVAGPPDDVLVADSQGRVELRPRGGETVVADAEGYETTCVDRLGRNRFAQTGPGEREVVEVLHRSADVAGTVLLPGGTPAAGATVRSRGLAREQWTLRATTEEDGRFRLRGLTATWNSIRVEIEAPGYPAEQIDIDRGDAAFVYRLAHPAFVEVAVTDAAGSRMDVSSVVARWQRGTATGRRTADGRYEVGPLAPGVVTLEAVVEEPGEGTRSAGQTLVALRPGERRADVRIVAEALHPVTLRVRLRKGREIVAADAVVRRADGSEVRVEAGAYGEDGAPVRLPAGEAVTVEAAELHDGLAPGPALRVVSGTRDAPVTADVPVVAGTRAEVRAVDRANGAQIAGLHVLSVAGVGVQAVEGIVVMASDARFRVQAEADGWLPYDAEHTASDIANGVLVVRMSRGSTIRGRVLGAVPADVEVHVEAVVADGGGTERSAFTTTAADGTFELSGLCIGSGSLLVHCDEFCVLALPLTVGDGVMERGDIALPPLREVVANVVDARGRGTDSLVAVHGAPPVGGDVRTDSDGRVRVLLPARGPLVFRAWGGGSVARPVEIPHAPSAVRLVLEAEPRLLFRVPWSASESVEVRVRDPGSGLEWEAIGWREGDALRVKDFPAGAWDVVFRRAAGDVVVRVDAAPGEIREVVVGE